MTIDGKTRDEKLQYDMNIKDMSIWAFSSRKIDKHKHLTVGEILLSNQKKDNRTT